jgi:hypothetical protein
MTEAPLILTPLPRLPMTKAVRSLLAEVTGKPWEIRRIPRVPATHDDGTLVVPEKLVPAEPVFGILYPQWRTFSGPQYADQHADVVWHYQATIAVRRGDQGEVWGDKVIRALVGRTADLRFAYDLDIPATEDHPGMRVIDRTIEEDGSDEGVGDSATGVVTVDIRFSLSVTPTSTPIV